MLSEHELLGGVLRVNYALLALSIVALLHFFVTYLVDVAKSGWKVDYWTFTLFMVAVLPIFIMYPFVGSKLNILAVGDHYQNILKSLNEAFLISVLGYVAIWVGRYSRDALHGRDRGIVKFNAFERMQYANIRNRTVINLFCYVYLVLLLALILFMIKSGIGSDPRAFFLEHGALRPFFNGVNALYIVVVLIVFARYLALRDTTSLLFLLIFIAGSLFLGSRASSLGSILSMAIMYALYRRGRVSLLLFGFLGVVMISLALIMGAVRDGVPVSSALLGAASAIFYGNNFSDVRDFAWVLSYQDGEMWWGKSYIAALISFIPREFSALRSEWAVSVITSGMVGFDPKVHPGLRTGIFGEAYFNFGLAGVVVLGFFAGYYLRAADQRIKRMMRRDPRLYSSMVTPFVIVSAFFITAGFFALYMFVFVHIGLALGRLLLSDFMVIRRVRHFVR